jgi:hypothetical protein
MEKGEADPEISSIFYSPKNVYTCDDVIPVHEHRNGVLGVHGEELGCARAATQHVHLHVLVVQAQHVQRHVHGTRGRGEGQRVQFKLAVVGRHLGFAEKLRQ